MEQYISTTTAFATTIMEAYFTGFFQVLTNILPFGIGIAIFYMGYDFVNSALNPDDYVYDGIRDQLQNIKTGAYTNYSRWHNGTGF